MENLTGTGGHGRGKNIGKETNDGGKEGIRNGEEKDGKRDEKIDTKIIGREKDTIKKKWRREVEAPLLLRLATCQGKGSDRQFSTQCY